MEGAKAIVPWHGNKDAVAKLGDYSGKGIDEKTR